MPKLHVLQSIWGLDSLRGRSEALGMSQRLTMIREAGFDGISAHFYEARDVASWMSQAREYGFVIEGCAFPAGVDDLRPALELAARYRIHHVVVQGDVRPYNAAAAEEIVGGWQRLSAEYGVPVLVETHRNTLSTDLWMMCELLDRVPDLPLLADLSHYVCGQEIKLPLEARNVAALERVLANTDAFQGRVSSSQQMQIEIGWDLHQPWVEQFQRWWQRGFEHWLARAQENDSITFTCELGPAPYAISDENGQDRSDRWEDAQLMRKLVLEVWQRALKGLSK